MAYYWRTGDSVGRTIYIHDEPESSDRGRLVGLMDTPELARIVVDAVNGCAERQGVVDARSGAAPGDEPDEARHA